MEQKDIAMPPLPEEPAEEVVPAEVESTEPAQEEPVVEQAEQKAAPTDREINFAALREEKARLERDHELALKKLKQYEEPEKKEILAKDDDLDIEMNDDDLFEGKHYKKIQRAIRRQKEELDKYKQQVNATSTEAKLRNVYTDFDAVLTAENIQLLRKKEPEIAETIASNKDVYTKAVSAYKMIKKLGIYVEDNYNKERETAKQNSLKPRPLASVSPQQGDSPLSRANAFANGLTDDAKAQLWKEMNEASKGY